MADSDYQEIAYSGLFRLIATYLNFTIDFFQNVARTALRYHLPGSSLTLYIKVHNNIKQFDDVNVFILI